MKYVLGLAGLIALAGCADGSTSPAPAPTSYVTTATASIMNPRTHTLEPVTMPALPSGFSADIAGGTGSGAAVLAASNAPGVSKVGGVIAYHGTDSLGRAVKLVLIYRSTGGPPAAIQYFIGGQLQFTTANVWTPTGGGWYRSSSLTRVVNPATGGTLGNYTLAGTYTTTTKPCSKTTSTNCGPAQMVRASPSGVQRALGYAALGIASLCFPADAAAQGFGGVSFSFSACRQQWLKYAGAAAVLAGASAVIAYAPVVTPWAVTGWIAAMTGAAALEDLLIDCMIEHDGVASNGFQSGSPGEGASGSAGGSGGGSDGCSGGNVTQTCTTISATL